MKNIACQRAQIRCGLYKHGHFMTDTLMRLIKVIKATRINRNNRRIICDSGTPVTKEWKRVSGFLSRKFKNTSLIPIYTLLKKLSTQRQISLPAQAATFFLTGGGIRWLPASTENPVLVAFCYLQTSYPLNLIKKVVTVFSIGQCLYFLSVKLHQNAFPLTDLNWTKCFLSP